MNAKGLIASLAMVLSSCSASNSAPTTAANSAPTNETQKWGSTGKWEIFVVPTESGAPGCVTMTAYPTGDVLGFIIGRDTSTKQSNFRIIVLNESWVIPPNQSYSVTVTIDEQFSATGRVQPWDIKE